MGVVISLVAIPLRENVPIFSKIDPAQNPGTRLETSSRPGALKATLKASQVIEIANT
jgi:hypothetical protein